MSKSRTQKKAGINLQGVLVKVIHDEYKMVEKVDKKSGEKYQGWVPVGNPCGVVLALKSPRGPVKLGWSKCNLQRDKFNKQEGIKKALKNLHPIDNLIDCNGFQEKMTTTVYPQVQKMAKRAKRFFKIQNQPKNSN